MIENMIGGRPFLYQAREGAVYHVSGKGVEAAESWPSEETIVAFVDLDKKYEPNEMLRRRSVQMIVAASPKGTSQKWIKYIGHSSSVTPLVARLWSQKELLLTGWVLALLSTLD
jgi:hypothetical protein